MARRGSYAKGVAKRDEILTEALRVIARNGYSRTSVRELADAVGLSQAGLLHYFSSKEELFAAVLHKRDEVDARDYSQAARADADSNDLSIASLPISENPFVSLATVMRHNTEVAGLAQLYTRLAAEATDPKHPAHDFFVQRGHDFRKHFASSIRASQAAGKLSPTIDPDKVSTIMIALADGLQTQWMIDPELDMGEHIDYLAELLGLVP